MVLSLMGLPRYVVDWLRFRKTYTGRLRFYPCLHDRYEEGGATKNEYFWQDLHVARKIHANAPEKHVDIGSRLDGFAAHLASFRDIEVFDIRPVTPMIPGITFRQADMTSLAESMENYCDSLSCLHALEHFGLGRYGDPINPEGYKLGLRNMARLLRKDGLFYLSVPIGRAVVEFNAHHVFDPRALVVLARTHGLHLRDFCWIEGGNQLVQSESPESDLEKLALEPYALGIFTFEKQECQK